MVKKSKVGALNLEDAASLVQGEEHRLLVRHGRAALAEPSRTQLIQAVSQVETFQDALDLIAEAVAALEV